MNRLLLAALLAATLLLAACGPSQIESGTVVRVDEWTTACGWVNPITGEWFMDELSYWECPELPPGNYTVAEHPEGGTEMFGRVRILGLDNKPVWIPKTATSR